MNESYENELQVASQIRGKSFFFLKSSLINQNPKLTLYISSNFFGQFSISFTRRNPQSS